MKKRTIPEAIVEVFNRVGHPLRVKEIYARILEWDLYRFRADDPIHIVRTQLRRHCEGMDFQTARSNKLFIVLKDGTYYVKSNDVNSSLPLHVLGDSIKQRLVHLHQEYTAQFKTYVLSKLKELDPISFEIFSKELLIAYGFQDMVVTRPTKDGGIDGHGTLKVGISPLNVAFQCKRYKNKTVGRREIDQFRGAVQGDFVQGIFFTTSQFSAEATKIKHKPGAVPIILIDGPSIVEIMFEKNFGIEVKYLPLYSEALDLIFGE